MVQVDDNELDSIFWRISRASSSEETSWFDLTNNEISATFPITDTKQRTSKFEYRVCHIPGKNRFSFTAESGKSFAYKACPWGNTIVSRSTQSRRNGLLC